MFALKPEDNSATNLSFLTDSTSRHTFAGQQPLTTNTTFTLSQLPALKAMLNDLKSKMPTLQDVQLGFDTAKDERREERREYIEKRTKSHLERNGQSVGSDTGSLSGKRTETAEVEALEKAASVFNPP